MSRDIRSFFTKSPKGIVAPKEKKPVSVLLSSDEDDKSAKASKQPTKKPASKQRHRTLRIDSSDEETPVIIKVTENSKKKASPKKEQLKLAAPSDIFGKSRIKRVNAPEISKKLQKKEAEFHDDDEFAATLSELDTSQLEQEYFNSVSKDNSSKRPNIDQSEQDVDAKKIRLDSASSSENVNSNGKEKRNSAKTSGSSTSGPNTKKKKTTKSEIVFEKTEKKVKKEKEEPVDVYAEDIEKKKQRVAQYERYLQRGGARNPGSKPIPEGASNCLAGLSFVVTGVLDSLEREEADELIKKYGGRVSVQIAKRTNYVVVGEDAGPSKLAKAASFGTKQITEDDLLDMIRTRPAGKSKDIVQPKNGNSKTKKRSRSPEKSSSPSPKKVCLPVKVENSPIKDESKAKSSNGATENISKPQTVVKMEPIEEKFSDVSKSEEDSKPSCSNVTKERTSKLQTDIKMETIENKFSNISKREEDQKASCSTATDKSFSKPSTNFTNSDVGQAQALVEKYRPKSMKQIIGQHGDKSNAKKFEFWLRNWHKNQNGNTKLTKPSPWAKNDDGAFFKACMLSGPPGVGKTTTAQVVCAELGYDLLEFNASDTRSKRLLKEEVAGILSNTTVKGYFDKTSKPELSKKHVLLMDEVDGMAGNEDRGGLQELIALIKSSEIPIICICNDRNHPKMRTLSNYTFDLRFQKPRLEQIRGAMKSMCCKENIVISTEDLDRLIQSTNQDIRQIINHLAMLSGGSGGSEKTDGKRMNKDLRLGPWDVIQKVFSANEHKTMSIHDKSDLFFHDYNIAALFVQENYLSVTPKAPSNELLERVAQTAESLAMGDLIENAIRGNGAWSLLPTQAFFSSVIPGSVMSGQMTARANFPAWLGRNSKRGKFDRLLQEITVHARLATGASKEAINIDYLSQLKDAVLRPLALHQSDGIETSLNVMNHYHLLREDLESMVEVSLWPGQRDPLQVIDSKVKAAFTRAYNKLSAPAPFITNTAAPKKKTNQASQDEGFMEGDEEEGVDSDDDKDDMDLDRMIKAKKATAPSSKAAPSGKTASKPAAKRGRGRGKAK